MAIFSCVKLWNRPSKSKTKQTDLHRNKFKSAASSDGEKFARRRIQKELRCGITSSNQPCNCSDGVDEDDIFKWKGVIIGPSNTPYEGGVFFLSIEFTSSYPFCPPKIKFLTKIFHPNISQDGRIHVDILEDRWTPALNIEKMLLSICSLLPDPNAEKYQSPICKLYRTDRKSFNKTAREWTIKYAMA